MFYTKMLAVSLKKTHYDSRNYINFDGRKIYLLTRIEIRNMNERKLEFIQSFEKFVEENYTNENDIWKDVNEISSITGTTSDTVVKYVESFDEFVKNSKGGYTTKQEYFKRTKTFKRITDLLDGRIK